MIGTGLAVSPAHDRIENSGGAKVVLNSDGTLSVAPAPANGALFVGSNAVSKFAVATLTGTANQLTVTNGAGSVTLSLPQDIHTAATPTFAGLTLTGALTATVTGAGLQTVATLRNLQAAAANVGETLAFSGIGPVQQAIISAAWNGAATTDAYLALSTRGSNVLTERMRIASTGGVTIAAPDSGVALTVPTITGGTGTTSTLSLQSTSGVGAAGADIIFKVGNNGGTEAMRILNSGNVGIGTATPTLVGLSRTEFVVSMVANDAQISVNNANASLADTNTVGVYNFFASGQSAGHTRIALVSGIADGGTANERGGKINFSTKANASTSVTTRMTIGNAGNVTIAAPDSGTSLTVSSATPASVSSGNGTAGNAVLALTWGNGGAVTTASGTIVGGAAAAQSFTLGAGGAASGASTQNTGGAGAGWTFVCGAGGAATNATTNIGGAGGGFTITTGNSGAGAQGNVNGGNLTVNLGTATGTGTAGIVKFVSAASTTHIVTTTSGDVDWQVFANDTGGAAAMEMKAGNGTTSSNYAYSLYNINASTPQLWQAGCYNTTNYVIRDGSAGAVFAAFTKATGALALTPAAAAGGAVSLTITPGAHTALTAEVLDISLGAHTVTLTDTTTIALARSTVLGATTYVGAAGGGSEIVTTAITMEVTLPVQGANLTITNAPIAARLLGNVVIGNVLTPAAGPTNTLTLATGTAPTVTVADACLFFSKDAGAAAGFACPHMMVETNALPLVVAGVALKADTGQVANPYEGLLEINAADNTVKIYADAGWRTIASGW